MVDYSLTAFGRGGGVSGLSFIRRPPTATRPVVAVLASQAASQLPTSAPWHLVMGAQIGDNVVWDEAAVTGSML